MVRYVLSILVALLLPLGTFAAAQDEWNPIEKASGWASFDRDGTCAFYDPASKQLFNWGWEAGIQGQVDLSRLAAPPEKWVVDAASNVWTITGTTLQFVDKNGRTGPSLTLPAEVGDLAWDARSFVLCYRTQGLYVEKRDLKGGAVLWSYGDKPAKGTPSNRVLHRVAIKEDGSIIVASGASLGLTTLDGAKGKPLAPAIFTINGAPAPLLSLGQQDRGGLQWGLGTDTAMAAVPASQVPDLKLEGLLLLKLDFAQHTGTIISTGLAEGHQLAGILEKIIVFRAPTGGLAFIATE
jgi:hypothetical protein